MGKMIRDGKVKSLFAEKPQIHLILYSNSDYSHHHFCVPADMQVADFLELALERLARGKGAERVRALKENYEPVLELPSPEGERELANDISLAEAGVTDQAICRIAARPRKERIMFCRYS